jgi:UDP-2-acetamido-2-deoxy-ribo-hexuluronate aminotransferase
MFTNDDDLAHTIRGIVNHGMYVRYHHDVVGVNSRLNSIQAAILRAKFPNLDAYNDARRLAASKYAKAFQGVDGVITPSCFCACFLENKEKCNLHMYHQ